MSLAWYAVQLCDECRAGRARCTTPGCVLWCIDLGMKPTGDQAIPMNKDQFRALLAARDIQEGNW